MGWGPVDWVERVLPEAKLKNTTTLLFEIFRFERPIPRYLLKTVLPCKALGFSYGLITAVYMQLPKEFTTPLPTGRTLPSKTSDLPGIGDRDRRTEQTNHKKLYGTGLGNHEKSFNHRHYSMETRLSTHIWELRQRFRMVCEVENP